MNDKVKELMERVKLTPEEIDNAFDNAFDKPIEFDHKPTPEEIIAIRLKAVAEAATNKVLKEDLAWMEWEDIPTERGEYWVSAFIDGRYISPRILTVIDYQRPDRGLEVQHDSPHDTIPVKTFTEEYYPNAKWMLIKEPIPSKGSNKGGTK